MTFLFPPGNRPLAKKIWGRLDYFGPREDPNGALQRVLDQKDDLLAGRKPRVRGEGLSTRDLANRFLTTKRHLADAGELRKRTFHDHHASCERVIEVLGKSRLLTDLAPDDFEALRSSWRKPEGQCRWATRFSGSARCSSTPTIKA